MPRLRSLEKVLTFEAEIDGANSDVGFVRAELDKWMDSSEYMVEESVVKKCWVCGPNSWINCIKKRGFVSFCKKRFRARLDDGVVRFDADDSVALADLPSVWRRNRRGLLFSCGLRAVRKIRAIVPAWWLRSRLRNNSVEFMGRVVKVRVLLYRNAEGKFYNVVSTFGDLKLMGITPCIAKRRPKVKRSLRIAAPRGGSVFKGGLRMSARLLEKRGYA